MDFERLGSFYLGKECDEKSGELLDRPLMYDARDLTTHAVCVGMTGSGKTGLCINLLEEAAIDRVPAIIIDPKGDISNLLLTFPDLRPEDFLPWVNVDDARRKGLSLEQHAGGEAKLWKKGLASWGQDGERIQLLKDAADFVVYTPGSTAGVPVSILHSFTAPDLDWTEDAEVIEKELRQKAEEITLKWDETAGQVERVPVTPRRTDIDLDFFGLAWVPHWQITWKDGSGRTRTDYAPAI